MKALSIWQPHASLITTGDKLFETRHWTTKVRGDILIHAALEQRDLVQLFRGHEETRARYFQALEPILNGNSPSAWWKAKKSIIANLPLGKLVGIATLSQPLLIGAEISSMEAMLKGNGWGNFLPGRFAWPLSNVRRFVTPIPWKGRQGFFECDIDLS